MAKGLQIETSSQKEKFKALEMTWKCSCIILFNILHLFVCYFLNMLFLEKVYSFLRLIFQNSINLIEFLFHVILFSFCTLLSYDYLHGLQVAVL